MFCVSAGLHALRRVLGSRPALSDVQVMNRVKVTTSDLRLAMTEVKPSAMREVAIDVPKVQFHHILWNIICVKRNADTTHTYTLIGLIHEYIFVFAKFYKAVLTYFLGFMKVLIFLKH